MRGSREGGVHEDGGGEGAPPSIMGMPFDERRRFFGSA
jgi:hypothetical protein